MKSLQILFFIFLSSLLHGERVLIDFGHKNETTAKSAAHKYNNITDAMDVNLRVALVDVDNQATGITLTSTNWFAGANTKGVTDASATYASTATKDSLYDANASWNSRPGDTTVVLVFGGLDPLKIYDFTMFASRMESNDNRSTVYRFKGGNSDASTLNPANNVTDTASVSGIFPNTEGIITLTITPGEDNENKFDFIYLGTLEINVVTEAATTSILMLGALD